MTSAVHTGLYDPNAASPQLNASRCENCGTVAFPAMQIGCEVCGATDDQLAAITIAASGVLHSVATVHLHSGKDIEAPFTMAEIKLDDGPLIRATLLEHTEVGAIGQRVMAVWFDVGTDDDGNDLIEPRFTRNLTSEQDGTAS